MVSTEPTILPHKLMPSTDGFMDYLTPKQGKVLEDFKEKLAEEKSSFNYPPINRFLDDYTLLRFLRARKFKLEKTWKMFVNFIQWRKDFGTDEIMSFRMPELPEVKVIYPHGYHKTDKLGRPLYIERIGVLNVDSLFKVTTEERMLKYYVREYEKVLYYRFPYCCKATGKRVEQSFTVIDLTGGSSKIMTKKVYKFIKIASGVGQDYFPEMLGKMFIVSAPFIFKAAWAIIKAFIDAKTKKKITILGSKFQNDLLAYVAAENLPDFLGGTCKCEEFGGCLNSDAGPWSECMSQIPKETDPADMPYPTINTGFETSKMS